MNIKRMEVYINHILKQIISKRREMTENHPIEEKAYSFIKWKSEWRTAKKCLLKYDFERNTEQRNWLSFERWHWGFNSGVHAKLAEVEVLPVIFQHK